MANLPDGYHLCDGSLLERALLLKFLQQTYRELQATDNFAHLAQTLDQYFSLETPLWWVVQDDNGGEPTPPFPFRASIRNPIACLWLGSSIDQTMGDRHAHIFLLYVMPEHRRRGIGKGLIRHAEDWARARGDRQIGLQVFLSNQPAVNLYQSLGYQTQSLWMLKPL